ncbi:DUF2332 domain-containing protein [Sphingomonas sp. SUN039]|uniref:DUF2332 domain-containing protein n=1 Tax=Sphingomonas sp. SUN039 TaxID=2937787 RepID=UPI002164CD74|nr:DUF2332 family protein [Sphingomonas sp. SUN039]UVO55382.1 DUF2332 family protein [Sphingomonas sp. SUN039]
MTFDEAMTFQAEFCEQGGAPVTARVCRALAAGLDRTTATGRRVHDWPGNRIADAMPLRLVAPYHALFRKGAIPAFDTVEAIRAATAAHDDWICGWLDGPPQTNEPARSASFMAALLVLADRFGLPFELLEIGSSAGLNLLIDRYRYDLGGSVAGPERSPVLIEPAWRGSPPPQADVRIASVRGVDIAPIDVTDPAAAERLMGYVWIDAPERIARVEAAIRMIRERPVDMVQGDAADWVEARLTEPQATGSARVLMHSIVWQYLSPGGQARITAAMEAAGAAATRDRPLAWVRMEADTERKTIQLHMTAWPGGQVEHRAAVHPHGAWLEWLA